MNNGVFIPIEIMSREYISKLLLSIELVKRGMPVILGHKAGVLNLALKTEEPGILFYKSTMAGGMEDSFQLLKNKGFGVVAQDEEAGIIFDNYRDFYNIRTSLKYIDELDMFFTWGNDEYNFLVKIFGDTVVKNTGSCRVSFWGEFGKKFYKNEISKLNAKYSNFALIVSNLATYNSYLTSEGLFAHLKKYDGYNEAYSKRIVESEQKVFNQYVKLIKFISRSLKTTVVVRPHPAESIELWRKALHGLDNVFVERSGELITWVLASDYIVQNNCTSAIEAAASGIPVITYYDEDKDLLILSDMNENIPNNLSIKVQGENEFIKAVSNVKRSWNEREAKCRRDAVLKRKIKYNGINKSSELIADELTKLTGLPNTSGNSKLGKDSFLYDLKEMYRLSRFRPRTKSVIMDINKRETLSRHKLKNDIELLSSILKLERKIKFKRIGPNTFYLFPLEPDYEQS